MVRLRSPRVKNCPAPPLRPLASARGLRSGHSIRLFLSHWLRLFLKPKPRVSPSVSKGESSGGGGRICRLAACCRLRCTGQRLKLRTLASNGARLLTSVRISLLPVRIHHSNYRFRQELLAPIEIDGGSGRIRTSETFAGLAVFETAPFNHSGTLPYLTMSSSSIRIFGFFSTPEGVPVPVVYLVSRSIA